ncbi:MAG TPA: hypothetical protein VHP35_05855, partial [Terriglobia bacterium]|nr:hypothetical protein [Terriglobia bacterium]
FAIATRSTERLAVCSEHVAIEESINGLSLPNAIALRVLQNSLWVSRVGFGRAPIIEASVGGYKQ